MKTQRSHSKASVIKSRHIVKKYETKRRLYVDFAETCRALVEKILARRNTRVHSVTCRAKDPRTLEEKLSRPGKRYDVLEDVTDLAGVRIITHFADDVDVIGRIIQEEFDIVAEESIDKRQLLDPDRFGYLSLHYVCTLPRRRYRLEEYAAYKGFTCEIQVRSILQHAWAEIEHDLGYKAPEGIPRPIRRRFSRLAGLLETADDEFIRIRDELAKYESEVDAKLQTPEEDLALDNISLFAFIQKDRVLKDIDEGIAAYEGAELRPPSPSYLDALTLLLRDAGIDTLRDLREALSRYQALIVEEWKKRFQPDHGELDRGTSLFHLWQVMQAERGLDHVEDAFRRFDVEIDRDDLQLLVNVVAKRSDPA